MTDEDFVTVIKKDGTIEKKSRIKHIVTNTGVTDVTSNAYLGYFPKLPWYECTCGFKWWGMPDPNKKCLRRKELITRMHAKGTY